MFVKIPHSRLSEFPSTKSPNFPRLSRENISFDSSTIMHRISSTTRVSDEFFNSSTPPSATPDADQLPIHNPLSHVAKKERARVRSAENAIHAIPLLLLCCAIVLWFFSSPAVDIINKGASIVPRPKDLAASGNFKSELTQNRLLADLKHYSDPAKDLLLSDQKGPKSSENQS